MCFVRPRPIPLLFFLACFGTTVALGTWQVERLHWKEGLIAEIELAKQQPPMTTLPRTEAELKAKEFYPVRLTGTWRRGIEYDLAPRYWGGTFGYALITPLELADHRLILINRGWIPARNKDIETRPETIVAGQGTVTGILRVGHERNYFTPKNQPAMDIWFGRDVEEMAAHYQLKNVIPAMVDAVGTQDAGHLPVPSDGTIRLRNTHLAYIITWYGIALGILVIFLVYHRKK